MTLLCFSSHKHLDLELPSKYLATLQKGSCSRCSPPHSTAPEQLQSNHGLHNIRRNYQVSCLHYEPFLLNDCLALYVAGKKVDGPRDLKASQVTPRTAVLSYKLSYYADGQDLKVRLSRQLNKAERTSAQCQPYSVTYDNNEVILDPTVKEFQLTRLYPASTYTAQLQAEQDGLYVSAISTDFTTGNLRFPFPTDCSQEKQNGVLESGIVEVFPQGREGKPLMVYCDMQTDGGGWTVFQRRKDGKTNFFRSWREYSNGFGALDGEFWLGNEQLHNFTKMSPMTLRVDLRAGDESVYARYSTFSVDNMKKHYTIRVSGYSGTAGDSLTYHNGRPFSTRDRDPQPFITRCAMSYRGGWWYRNCHEANLNGLYNTNTNHQALNARINALVQESRDALAIRT
ncbi:hypothetical protein M9458_053785 [Cirrhinus mrigala]|uniref:Fibrinogen C-terminal domain-containing protein n=1 Tax=Cirrhinus mrigala TaxID=683832 RepID=A0ABD0MPK1_CIRMR